MFKSKKIKAVICAVVLCMSVAFVGCGQKSDNAKENLSKIDKIKKDGKLVLGTCADYPPYEFHKMNDGKDEIIGFDIEIAKEMAKDLGVELEIKDMDFDGLIPSLKTAKVDIIISGMTPTPERAKEVDFSKIYYKAVQNVMIRNEDKEAYKSLEDLTGKKLGAQTSSIQEKIAKEQIKDSNVTSLGKVTELVLSLKTKKVDAIVVEGPVAQAYAEKNDDIMVSDMPVGNPADGSAIAIQKGNEDLVEVVNKTIDRLVSENKINEFVAKANELAE
ncbi:transporter substrate-binding domain-containing protein [Clostridium aestuarii]|uniref:Transporter substrate-binding domain-containing protein n=1 Tax=Clostridium aestuarii TaxID=338193 RepID=A0ABT4D3P9_9CLOT|nr:transporter substrate-binding domain-containing protein [Clostridium aestuarii]MCY6485272.1 transporter substrate-binding domain-containing protein [Clostridium aestuarii]